MEKSPSFLGDLTRSELARRITTSNPDDQMPPPASGRKVTPAQVDLLKRWISSGAKWEPHWSFVAAKRPSPPSVKNRKWPRNPIDNFILARLEQTGLRPSPLAPRSTLLRRVSLDLAGLPPAPAQLAAWSARRDPLGAAVDELLANRHFGERMASDWLDVARYADTHGFNNDALRSMWPWRDWVVRAFNQNMHYDQFNTDQLAGDLEKNPTLEQEIATGFNRNHGINSEGGIIDEEYRVSYVNDRVRTTSMAWMGLTMECARCHDHKCDPISQHDYYRFFAFFNNIDETGEDDALCAAPIIKAPTEEQQREIVSYAAPHQRIAREDHATTHDETKTGARSNSMLYVTHTTVSPRATNALDLCLTFASRTRPRKLSPTPVVEVLFKSSENRWRPPGPLGETAMVFDGQSGLKVEALPNTPATLGVDCLGSPRSARPSRLVFDGVPLSVPQSSGDYGRGVQILVTASGSIDVRSAVRWPGYAANIVTREALPINEWERLAVSSDGSTKAMRLARFFERSRMFCGGHP